MTDFKNGVAGAALRPQVMAVPKQRCENCAFVRPPTKRGDVGACHKGPPTVVLVMRGVDEKSGTPVMTPASIWPPVRPHDECGAWKPKVLGLAQTANDEG